MDDAFLGGAAEIPPWAEISSNRDTWSVDVRQRGVVLAVSKALDVLRGMGSDVLAWLLLAAAGAQDLGEAHCGWWLRGKNRLRSQLLVIGGFNG